LFELIIFGNKKIIKFYYKRTKVLFFLLSLLNFNLLYIINEFKYYRVQNSQVKIVNFKLIFINNSYE